MRLQSTLQQIKDEFEKKAPAEAISLMHRATNDLQASGLVEKSLQEGQKAPDFELEDSQGQRISLQGLLNQGPLIMTFFRGHW